MSNDDQSCDNMDEDAKNEESIQLEVAAAPKGNPARPTRGAKRRGRGRPKRNDVRTRNVGKTSEAAKKSGGAEVEDTQELEERDSDGDKGSVDNEVRSSVRLSGIATRRSSGVTYEEPPDSAVSEDGSSLGKNNENNGVDRVGSPTSSNGADQFLGFPQCNPGVTARDDGSEAGSESEAAAAKGGSEERDIAQRRGRGKKRGRKKRLPDFPPEAVSALPDYLRQELQYAFEIYSALRSVNKVGPFLDKPLPNMYGMSTYSCVIKTPMYLYEVRRKLMCHGYSSLSEFIRDIRLMLENCYTYWGTDHVFSRVALQLETKLEQKIDALPSNIKDKCKDITLDGVDANDLLKMEADDFRNYSEDNNTTKPKPKVAGFSSKILCKLSNSGVEIDRPLPAVDKEREELIVAWEATHLTTPDIKHQISSVWEIAAIGLFLNMAHEHLNLTKISLYEIERMLLMPKESLTLANIMTSLLSSSTKRALLDPMVPVMSYQVWNERLRKRVEEWFNVYYTKNGSESEVFSTCGVEPNFWKTMSYMNHFEDKNFSDITYHQRCSILKAICDNLCCTSKSFQDLFTSDSKTEPTDETVLGCLNQFVYFYVPFWPDFRVYRVKALLPSQVNSMKNLSILSNKLIKYSVKESSQEITDGSRADLFEGFYLVADSREELSNTIEKIKCLNSELASNLTAFSDRVDSLSTSPLPTLSVMYEQWSQYDSRKKHFDDQSIAYWCNEVNNDRGYFNVDDPDILGKRKRSIKYSATDNNYSSSEEEVEDIFDNDDDGSDWECPSEKKKTIKRDKPMKDGDESEDKEENKIKRKKRPTKPPKSKKTRTDSTEKTKEDASDPCLNKSTVVIDKVKSLVNDNLSADMNIPSFGKDIIIKTEPCDDIVIKTEAYDNVKTGGDEVQIKKEKEDKEEEKKEEVLDVISLSSQEEEEDDDVILTTPVKEMPKPVPLGHSGPIVHKGPLVAASIIVRPPNVPNNVAPRTPLRTPPVTPVRSPRVATPGTPTSSPRMTTSPRLQQLRMTTSPRIQTTPRQRLQSPNSFNPSPTGFNTSSRLRSPMNKSFPATPPKAGPTQVSRNLFSNARAPQPSQPQPPNAQTTKKTITAKLTFGKRDDGSYGYLARLPDGGVINMSPQQIESIRKKNGTIPPLINIPIG